MYIKIKSDLPKIVFVNTNKSNLIKKEEVLVFYEAKDLLVEAKKDIETFQKKLDEQIINLISEKEKSLNDYLCDAIDKKNLELEKIQEEWNEKAQDEFNDFVDRKSIEITELTEKANKDYEKYTLIKIKKVLDDLHLNDKFLAFLIELLHEEIEDNKRELKVVCVEEDKGKILKIENEDQVVVCDIKEFIEEMKSKIDQANDE